ncbi:hypothetical protein ACFQXA_27995 [Nocardiopsis composta]
MLIGVGFVALLAAGGGGAFLLATGGGDQEAGLSSDGTATPRRPRPRWSPAGCSRRASASRGPTTSWPWSTTPRTAPPWARAPTGRCSRRTAAAR